MKVFKSPIKSILGVLIALVGALATVPEGEAQPGAPELYVVAVQINNKVFAKGETPNSREAKLLEKLAAERSKTFYAKVHTRVLSGEQADRDNIVKALGWLEKKVRKQDVAVVFLAGHGSFNPKANIYAYHPLGGAIKGFELREAFDKIPGRNVLLLQTCHAKAVLQTAGGEKPLRNTLVVAACDDDEQANWLMGKVMVNGLAGLAADKDGTVTTKSLSSFLEKRVHAISGGKQSLSVSRPAGFTDFPLAPKGKPVDE